MNYGKHSLCGSQLVLDFPSEKAVRSEYHGGGGRERETTIRREQLLNVKGWKQVRRCVSRSSKNGVVQLRLYPNEKGLVSEVLMAKSKSCKNSKGCGASCISGSYLCQIDLSPSDTQQLDKVADILLSRADALKTPEQARNWLAQHAADLASTQTMEGAYGSKNPDLLYIAIEPGGKPSDHFYGPDGQIALQYKSQVSPQDLNAPGPRQEAQDAWYSRNPVTYVNDLRLEHQLKNLYANNDPSQGDSVTSPRRSAEIMDKLRGRAGGIGRERGDNMEAYANSAQPYFYNMPKIFKGTGIQEVATINLSTVHAPSGNYWPLAKLGLPASSPFASRENWMKYSAPKASANISNAIKRSKAKAVYFGGSQPAQKKIFKDLATSNGTKPVTKYFEFTSASGQKKKMKVEFFKTKEGTLVVNAPHTSYTWWGESGGNRTLNDVNKLIKEQLGVV